MGLPWVYPVDPSQWALAGSSMDKGFEESMPRRWTVQDMSCRLNDGLLLESWSVWDVCVVLDIVERVGLCHCGLRSSVVSGVHSCYPDVVSPPVASVAV